MAETELAGFEETRQALQELSSAVQKGLGRRALLVPAEMFRAAMQARAAVSSRPSDPSKGSLRASGQVLPAKRMRGSLATVAVMFHDPAAVANEYGTTKMSAQPFGRPAVDATQGAALAAFGEALKIEVFAAVERAARKSERAAAKGGG